MAATKRIKRALVSVYHKDGLDEILKKLHREGVSFVSTVIMKVTKLRSPNMKFLK